MATLGSRLARAAMALCLFASAQGASAAPAAATPPPAPKPLLAPDQPIPPLALEALVDATVRQAMDRDHIAGVTVAVVQDGQVVLKKGYGFADVARRRPVDPDRTLFRVGSISKTFTWLMTLNAIDHGQMKLDAPLNSYLPPKVRIPGHPGYRQVSVRDAMTHTPGFEDTPLKHLFMRDPAELRPIDDDLAAQRPDRVFPPGEVDAYSNYAAALTGDALAHAEGQPWQDLLEAEILKPAGMAHTTGRELYPPRAGLPAPMPASLAPDMSVAYRWTGASFTADPFELIGGFAPAGAISSTASDMARYMTLLLNGGAIDGHTVYGPATAAAIRTPMRHYSGDAAVDAGFFQSPLGGGLLAYGHNGATMDFHSDLMIVPALRLGVFISANTENEHTLTNVLPALIAQTFYTKPPAPLPPTPALLRDAALYNGEYQTTRRPFHGMEAFAMSLLATPVSVAAPGYLTLGSERFVATSEPGLLQDANSPWLQIRVVAAPGKAATRILAGGQLVRSDWLHQTRTLGIVALLAILAAIGVLFGLASPARWRLPQTRVQRIAGALRGPAAALWLFTVPAFALKLQGALSDQSSVVYGWPQPIVVAAATAALVAAVLSWAAAALTPFAWAGRDGWSTWRKLRFTATIVAFSAFGLLLAFLGALQPWNP
ncbi:MAG TPA: serine hydrolase domain-containing protein [Phenylobacterium sp.]|jgi:CubicO group peptidase (beta-lactamase class C family)|uniref:serine hydrolase domain-containing protein n=1 Tax=Phenylobacterium sp. TaxID=1871053 RepID=UPI002D3389F1|nr:serine hydrolase domain-containing protein [Phenylobacterium sp.]HZZ68230.1 serine hydrolase domain-containing protein [Phenylobacterium sp.]